jgi:hypothetical protein
MVRVGNEGGIRTRDRESLPLQQTEALFPALRIIAFHRSTHYHSELSSFPNSKHSILLYLVDFIQQDRMKIQVMNLHKWFPNFLIRFG